MYIKKKKIHYLTTSNIIIHYYKREKNTHRHLSKIYIINFLKCYLSMYSDVYILIIKRNYLLRTNTN